MNVPLKFGEVRRVVPVRLAEQPGAECVLLLSGPVDVVGELQRLRLAVVVLAGAAGVEGLWTTIVGSLLADDSFASFDSKRTRSSWATFGRIVPLSAKRTAVSDVWLMYERDGEIEAPDAEVVPLDVIALHLEQHLLRLRERVIDADRSEHPILGCPHAAVHQPSGVVALIVFESYELLPSSSTRATSALDDRTIGVEPEPPVLFRREIVGANAFRAFSDSSRKPKLLTFPSSRPCRAW